MNREQSEQFQPLGQMNPKMALERLKADNDRMMQDLMREKKEAGLGSPSPSAAAQIARLHEQARGFEARIEAEKERVADLDREISVIQEKIMEQRKRMGGVNAARENNQQIQKQIRVLENRLEKAYVKYNEAVAHNKRLREQIDSLRRERLVFDQIYKKLERELHEKKRQMEDIIQRSNAAYEERDKAIEQMAALRRQAEGEQGEFRRRWERLGQAIEENRRVKEFMRQKDRDEDTRGDTRDRPQRRQPREGQWTEANERGEQNSALEKVQTYTEAFQRIQEATGVKDVDELVAQFVAAEDENFTLFNYVNELNHEAEKLDEQIAETQREIDQYRGQGSSHESQRRKILEELESRLERTESKATAYERKFDAATSTVATLKEGIQTIFDKLGCSMEGAVDVLGEGGVTDANMMPYLGIIEQRINEILQNYAHTQGLETSGNALAALLGPGPQVAAGAAAPGSGQIAAPSVNDLDGDDEEGVPDDVPLTRTELEARLARKSHATRKQHLDREASQSRLGLARRK